MPLERELKYVLPASAGSLARSMVSALTRPDAAFPFATVSTIYYDTPDLRLLGEKINSDYLKTKVRLRWYAPSRGATTAFLEVKSRVGGLRQKVRIETPLEAARAASLPLEDPQFVRLLDLLGPSGVTAPARLMPALLLRYDRSRHIEGASGSRVSVDTRIEAVRANPRLLGHVAPHLIASAVVEVKGTGDELPRALHPVVALGARRAAFSKYAAAGVAMLRYVP
jgi:hypothetical protein